MKDWRIFLAHSALIISRGKGLKLLSAVYFHGLIVVILLDQNSAVILPNMFILAIDDTSHIIEELPIGLCKLVCDLTIQVNFTIQKPAAWRAQFLS